VSTAGTEPKIARTNACWSQPSVNLLSESDTAAVQQRAISLIRPLIQLDAGERVERAITQYNRLLRGHIREETGFSLADDNGRGSVPIRIVDGFPAEVARLIDKYQEIVLWRLIMLQPKLGGVVEGLGGLLQQWDDFERWVGLPDVAKGSAPALERSVRVASALQTLAATRKVFQDLKEIQEDVLGAYHFGPRGSHIEIYWMAQALFAAAFGVRIEDLTVVTLAHELAHAYTHIGRDIDGDAWRDPGFAQTEKAVVEGLAQYYTAVVTERLRARAPEAFDTYRRLLEHQSAPYRAHESWFKKASVRRAEILRFAMLQARSRGKITDAEWRGILEQTEKDLTVRSRAG
jgi:hypothetical protein